MFNVGESVYIVNTALDNNGNPVSHFVNTHIIAGVHIDQSGIVYDFISDNKIHKLKEEYIFGSFDEIVNNIETNNKDLRVCRRCGAIFNAGEGFEISGLNLCLGCLGAVKEKLSEDNKESEPDKCECSCKNEKCDCKECECESEEVVEGDNEAVEESK